MLLRFSLKVSSPWLISGTIIPISYVHVAIRHVNVWWIRVISSHIRLILMMVYAVHNKVITSATLRLKGPNLYVKLPWLTTLMVSCNPSLGISWAFECYTCLTDWCVWSAPGGDETIADIEGETVAWCTKPGRGTRTIPDGAITGVQFLRAPGESLSLALVASYQDTLICDQHTFKSLVVSSNSSSDCKSTIQGVKWIHMVLI